MQDCGVSFGRFPAREVGRRVAAPRSALLPSRRAPHSLAEAELGRFHRRRGALGTGGTGATSCSAQRPRQSETQSNLLQNEICPDMLSRCFVAQGCT